MEGPRLMKVITQVMQEKKLHHLATDREIKNFITFAENMQRNRHWPDNEYSHEGILAAMPAEIMESVALYPRTYQGVLSGLRALVAMEELGDTESQEKLLSKQLVDIKMSKYLTVGRYAAAIRACVARYPGVLFSENQLMGCFRQSTSPWLYEEIKNKNYDTLADMLIYAQKKETKRNVSLQEDNANVTRDARQRGLGIQAIGGLDLQEQLVYWRGVANKDIEHTEVQQPPTRRVRFPDEKYPRETGGTGINALTLGERMGQQQPMEVDDGQEENDNFYGDEQGERRRKKASLAGDDRRMKRLREELDKREKFLWKQKDDNEDRWERKMLVGKKERKKNPIKTKIRK